jgi:hypothetical protein
LARYKKAWDKGEILEILLGKSEIQEIKGEEGNYNGKRGYFLHFGFGQQERREVLEKITNHASHGNTYCWDMFDVENKVVYLYHGFCGCKMRLLSCNTFSY